mgnify:FL=1
MGTGAERYLNDPSDLHHGHKVVVLGYELARQSWRVRCECGIGAAFTAHDDRLSETPPAGLWPVSHPAKEAAIRQVNYNIGTLRFRLPADASPFSVITSRQARGLDLATEVLWGMNDLIPSKALMQKRREALALLLPERPDARDRS